MIRCNKIDWNININRVCAVFEQSQRKGEDSIAVPSNQFA